MISCIFASLLGHAGITLSLPATSLKDALAEVSKQIPAPIYVEGKLADEMVCLHVQEMPIGELERALAKVSTGEWVERDGKKILTLSPARDKQQFRESFEERKQAIAEALAKRETPAEATRLSLSRLVAQVEEATTDMINSGPVNYTEFERARDRQFNLLKEAPADRLLSRIVKGFTADHLANLDESIRYCYSTSPNAVQRAFPFNMSGLLASFKREQTALKQLLPTGLTYSNLIDDRRRYSYEASPDCSELVLIVEANRTTGLPTFKLWVGDSEMRIRALAFTSLTRTNPKPAEITSLPEAEIPLSDHQQSLAYALHFMRASFRIDGQTKESIQEKMAPSLKWLSLPTEHEPLADFVGPTLVSTAKQSGKNLVALVPDSALQWVPHGKAISSSELNSQIVRRAETGFAKPWDALIENTDRLITITPRMPWRWRDHRINRRALERLFTSTLRQGTVTVLESAIYVANCGTSQPYETWSHDRHASGFGERVQGSFSSNEVATWYCRDLLRLLGRLPEQQLRAFLNGGEVSMPQLGRQQVERALFGRDQIFDPFLDPSLHWRDRRFEDRKLTDEVWEKLPNGIPSTFRFTCQRLDETFLLVQSGPVESMTATTPEELGRDSIHMDDYYPDAKFQTGKATKYEFRYLINPTLGGKLELREIAPGKRTSYNSLAELPDDIRQRIANGVEAARRRAQADGPTRGAGPPPP